MGNTDRYAASTRPSRGRDEHSRPPRAARCARGNVRGSSARRTGTMFNKSFSDLLEIREASASSAVGLAEAQGWRPTMEDAFVMNLDAVPGCSVVAVFDGHGGSTVSAYAVSRSSACRSPLSNTADRRRNCLLYTSPSPRDS